MLSKLFPFIFLLQFTFLTRIKIQIHIPNHVLIPESFSFTATLSHFYYSDNMHQLHIQPPSLIIPVLISTIFSNYSYSYTFISLKIFFSKFLHSLYIPIFSILDFLTLLLPYIHNSFRLKIFYHF